MNAVSYAMFGMRKYVCKHIEEKWINVDEVAKYFGVKPATIRDWIRKGKGIPAQKLESLGNLNILILINGQTSRNKQSNSEKIIKQKFTQRPNSMQI